MIRALLAAVLLLGAPCSQPEKPPPAPIPGPPRPIDPAQSCVEACTRMAELQCNGWRGSPGEDEEWLTGDDVPCWKVCEHVEIEAFGAPGISLHPDCVAAAASCEAANACNR